MPFVDLSNPTPPTTGGNQTPVDASSALKTSPNVDELQIKNEVNNIPGQQATQSSSEGQVITQSSIDQGQEASTQPITLNNEVKITKGPPLPPLEKPTLNINTAQKNETPVVEAEKKSDSTSTIPNLGPVQEPKPVDTGVNNLADEISKMLDEKDTPKNQQEAPIDFSQPQQDSIPSIPSMPKEVKPEVNQTGKPPVLSASNLPPLESILGDKPSDTEINTSEGKILEGELKEQTTQKVINPARILTNFNAAKSNIDEFMAYTIANNSSDLHIAANNPAFIRVDGRLVPIPGDVMTSERTKSLIFELLTPDQQKILLKEREIDLSYQHSSGDRFRLNAFFKQDQLSAALRLIPRKIKTLSELGLPEILYDFIKIPNGLVLVTGPTGSGKSTTIAAMLQEINVNRAEHIITIEDPIEYVYPRMKSLIEQREIGSDTLGWTRALKSVLRQDPNIVLVGEMRDYETIEATITVAETGHLVFATLHTNSASQTIDRIIDVFPEGQQSQIRAQLANVIVAVVSQRLVPLPSGGRKAVLEIMTGTSAVKNAIREQKTYQIDNIIQTSSEIGMVSLESSLAKLVKDGVINLDIAQNYTLKVDELMSLLKTT